MGLFSVTIARRLAAVLSTSALPIIALGVNWNHTISDTACAAKLVHGFAAVSPCVLTIVVYDRVAADRRNIHLARSGCALHDKHCSLVINERIWLSRPAGCSRAAASMALNSRLVRMTPTGPARRTSREPADLS